MLAGSHGDDHEGVPNLHGGRERWRTVRLRLHGVEVFAAARPPVHWAATGAHAQVHQVGDIARSGLDLEGAWCHL